MIHNLTDIFFQLSLVRTPWLFVRASVATRPGCRRCLRPSKNASSSRTNSCWRNVILKVSQSSKYLLELSRFFERSEETLRIFTFFQRLEKSGNVLLLSLACNTLAFLGHPQPRGLDAGGVFFPQGMLRAPGPTPAGR